MYKATSSLIHVKTPQAEFCSPPGIEREMHGPQPRKIVSYTFARECYGVETSYRMKNWLPIRAGMGRPAACASLFISSSA